MKVFKVMHNFKKYTLDSTTALNNIKLGTHEVKRKFIEENTNFIRESHKDYDEKAAAGALEDLKSSLKFPGKKEEHSNHPYWRFYDLFGSNLKYVAKHWEKLRESNGDETLICPICGLSPCREMDHFAPRSKFPEQSCHIGNLIPLCHNCNNDKGDAWMDKGNPLFFNAFYDTDLPQTILNYILVASDEGDVIGVKVELSPLLDSDNTQHKRIKFTIEKLNLLKRFEEEANKILNIHIKKLCNRYSISHSFYKSVADFLAMEKIIIEEHIKTGAYSSFIEKDLLSLLMSEKPFRDYILSQLTSLSLT